MGKKNKVLIIDNSPGVTGAYKSISGITAAIKEDFDFTFCLPENSCLVEASAKLRPTITLPFLEIGRHFAVIFYLPLLIANGLRLLRFINNNDIRILHVNDLYNLVGVLIKVISPKVKLIYHVRLLPSSYSGLLYRFWTFLIKRYADYTICVSQIVKHKFDGRGCVHCVISDAIDLGGVSPSRPLRPDDHVHLLYMANYTRGKGHDTAIKAFSLALKQNSNLRLLIVGDDFALPKNIEYKGYLRRLAQQEEVADKIVFKGFVADTSALFTNADIFLNFSESESFSLTCLEALFHGVPVISTDSGGPAELLQSGVSGVLVPVGDVSAMSKAMLSLSSDKAYRDRLGTSGKQYVMDTYNLHQSAQRLKEVYLNVMVKSL